LLSERVFHVPETVPFLPFNPLLNPPALPAGRYAPLADRLKLLLGTANDLVFVQAEAILALEAAATSLARPGLAAVNIVTSPYGGYFGQWLERGGAAVSEIRADGGQPITVEAVKAGLDRLEKIDVVVVVHGETSSGILNPLKEIAALAKARGALLVVDAVASFCGHKLDVDQLGIDVCVTGPQKALGGPAALSMVTVSDAAWAAMGASPSPSNLSLPDLKRNWLDTGRGVVPGMPSALEFWALDAAVSQLEAEGLDRRIARHEQARRATLAGLVAMGVKPWVADVRQASALATAATVPLGIDADALLAAAAAVLGVMLTPGFGEVRGKLLRLDHTGVRAAFTPVLANVVGFGAALQSLGGRADVGAGAAAVARAYSGV
jgi:aspartate aminotransferase-like enzyme